MSRGKPSTFRPGAAPVISPLVRLPEQPDLGHLKVYLRTDGKYIVTDDRLPAGKRTVWIGAGKLGAAISKAKEMRDAEACNQT